MPSINTLKCRLGPIDHLSICPEGRWHFQLALAVLATAVTVATLLALAGHGPARGAEAATITVPDDYSTLQAAVDAASDNDTIRIRAGTFYGATDVNKTVALVGDGTDKTVLDGQGHCPLTLSCRGINVTRLTVTGAGDQPGMNITGDGCNVTDVVSKDNAVGIHLYGTDENIIANCTLTGSWAARGAGLLLDTDSDRNVVTGVHCDENGNGAVLDPDCDDNRFGGCSFDGNVIGIIVWGARNLFLNCTALHNTNRAIHATESSYLNLTGCVIKWTMDDMAPALSIWSCNNVTVRGCEVSLNLAYGIRVESSDRVLVEGCELFGNSQSSIQLYTSRGVVVRGNRIVNGTTHGIYIGGNGNLVTGNQIVGNKFGIGITQYASGNDIFANNISESRDRGVYFTVAAHDNLVHNNTFLRNGLAGDISWSAICFLGSAPAPYYIERNVVENNTFVGNMKTISFLTTGVRYNTFRWNTIRGGDSYAISGGPGFGANTFHHNTFICGTYLVDAPNPGDLFDDGKEGNYWYDYAQRYPGARAAGRVWDTPYEVQQGATVWDRYPLAVLPDHNPPVADAGGDRTVPQGAEVEFDGGASWDDVGIANYTWVMDYGGLNPVGNERTYTFTFPSLGTALLTLTVADAWGNTDSDTAVITVVDITPPVAEAGDNITVNMGVLFSLDGSGSSDNVGVTHYGWLVDPGGLDLAFEGPIAEASIDLPGEYVAVLNVTDAEGLWATDSLVIHVLDSVPPVARAGPDVAVDLGQTVTLDGSASSDNIGIVDWEWSYEQGGGTVILHGERVNVTLGEPGSHVIILRVTDARGLSGTDALTALVRDAERPDAVAGPDQVVDQHSRVTLNGSGSSDNIGIASWTWTFDYNGSRRTLSGEVVEFVFDEAGSFQVALTVEDAEGNRATDLTVVRVRDTTPPVVDAGGDRTVALGAELALGAGSSKDNVGIKRSEWVVSGVAPVGGSGSTFRFAALGAFTATLTVWDLAGNEASATVTITVRDRTPPVAAAGPDRTAIEGEAVALDGSGSTDNVEVAAMFWTFEQGGKAENVSGPVLAWTFDAAGTTLITLHVLDAEGNAATDGTVVTVLSRLVAWRIGPFLDGSGTTVGGAKVTVTLNGTAYNGTTDPYGSVELQVKRRDLVSPARVVVDKEGWKGLVLTVPLDAGGVPVGTLPPMVREAGADGGISGLVVIAIVVVIAIAIVAAMVLWKRGKG
jgi:parallel beta-helix repeat protein